MARQVTLPAWKRRRYERLGIPLPPALGQRERKGPRVPDAPPHSEPSQPAAEHIAALADLRAMQGAERDAAYDPSEA